MNVSNPYEPIRSDCESPIERVELHAVPKPRFRWQIVPAFFACLLALLFSLLAIEEGYRLPELLQHWNRSTSRFAEVTTRCILTILFSVMAVFGFVGTRYWLRGRFVTAFVSFCFGMVFVYSFGEFSGRDKLYYAILEYLIKLDKSG